MSIATYDHRTFHNISHDSGMYAFFLNFERLRRRAPQGPTIEFERALDRFAKGRVTSAPTATHINLFGKSVAFSQFLDLEASHRIAIGANVPAVPRADYLSLCGALAKCSLLAGPIYVGQAAKQTFRDRFKQHRQDYNTYKASGGHHGKQHDEPGGKFGHRLANRGLEFRDLIFACVSMSAAELAHVDNAEKILHAFGNPPVSYAH